MKRICFCLVCAAVCFSTGCGDSLPRLCEAVPFDVVCQVCSEHDFKGVVISDLGASEAVMKAAEMFGSLDGVDSFAVFIPYPGASEHGSSSGRGFSTFAQSDVDKSACCEFGVLRLSDAGSADSLRLFERVCARVGADGLAVRRGRFILYAAEDFGERIVSEAAGLLAAVD